LSVANAPVIAAPVRPPLPWRGWLAAAIVFGILYWSALGTGFSLGELVKGLPQMQLYFARLLPSAQKPWPWEYLPTLSGALLETLRMSFLASVYGSALALPFMLLATRNLASPRVYAVGRVFLNFMRTVPEIIWGVLLVAAFGIGAFPGVISLTIFTFGIVAKLLGDTIETVDAGPKEAVQAAGGTRFQQARFSVFPQIAPDYVAYALYAFEINVRASVVLGLVGAGGIGVILREAISLFRYGRVGLIIAITFVAVLVIDTTSTFLRSKLV